jgi:hypothetical protein
MDFQAGSRVGDYILDAQVGAGSFGAVWQAHHAQSGQTVAIKLLTGSLASDAAAALRADIEVLAGSAAARSQHVVRVLGGGIDPVPFIVMEFVEGNDVQSLLVAQGRLTPRQTIDVGIGIADALRALFDAGIIHRDIKPANVMIDRDGVVKLTDFGIAKIVGYETLTMTGQTAMTMAYAAPEIWEESGSFGRPGNKSDLYAMGVLLFQCLAGTPPFSGNFGALYRAHTQLTPDFSLLPADAPVSLGLLIRRCIEKRQEDRPGDAAECLTILHRAEAELAEGAGVKEPSRFGPWFKDAPHESQAWAWRCHHETRGEKATVEMHFADSLDYASFVRTAVAASRSLTPLGAERLIETNRLLLHPDESWWEPPVGRFQFWVAREDRDFTPAESVTGPMFRSAVLALSELIAAASREGVALDIGRTNLSVLADGSIYLRRAGLAQPAAPPKEAAMTFLRGLPLYASARELLEAAEDFDALVALVQPLDDDATRIVPRPTRDDATVVAPRASAVAPPPAAPPVVSPEPSLITSRPSAPSSASTNSPPPIAPPRVSPASPRRPWPLFFAAAGAAAIAAVIVGVLLLSGGGAKDDPEQKQTAAAQTAPTAQGAGTAGATVEGLLFVSDRDGHEEIYVINADGSNATRLTNGTKANRLPNAAADGSRIAFISARDDGSELYVMNADGSAQRRIATTEGTKLEPNLSSDGKRIVFEVLRGDNYDIYTVDVDGSNLVNLTNSPSADIDPVWSPDGSRVVFGSNREGNMDIYVMQANGSNPRRLTNSPGFNGEPAWSPDGRRIVFESDRRGSFDIYVMNDDGTNVIRLGDIPGDEYDPAWSWDGSRIAFTSRRGGNAEVVVSNADGSQPTNLTNSPANDLKPAWIKLRRPAP